MENIFNHYWRLVMESPNATNDLESYKLILDSGFYLSRKLEELFPHAERNQQIIDGMTLFQMTLTKGLSLFQLIHGLNYHNPIGNFSFTNLRDPMSMSSIVRAQFEAFSNFHNIYNSSDNKDVSRLLYDLWFVAGLKERQRFVDDKLGGKLELPEGIDSDDPTNQRLVEMQARYEEMKKENKQKGEDEAKVIESTIENIHKNPIYLGLSEEKQIALDKRIKDREFQLIYTEGKFTPAGWRDLFLNAEVKEAFYHLYSSMSLNSHPSNVSVFQYDQMFSDNSNDELALVSLRISKYILAFMIADFCTHFPELKKVFQQLPKINQLIIDGFNTNYRSSKYQLSEYRMKFFEEHQADFLAKI